MMRLPAIHEISKYVICVTGEKLYDAEQMPQADTYQSISLHLIRGFNQLIVIYTLKNILLIDHQFKLLAIDMRISKLELLH